ncbi:BamA/TamA family outer membrane protein [Sphingobacterium sp. N143]|uniref:BamA/TamA family outer membrane protein n=1 Tax=Sphingobacterium sp. N143 TaxID=2746727 RepID=UPI002577D684|nr:BamA/TamA family outer membrane protein [Sphingobacterium sp. N143]MDM1293008.1 BamA/TamA family outer membrane protein [Sphingobacterium sp. N143]
MKKVLTLIACCCLINAHAQQDSITAVIAPEYDQVGLVHRFWLGDSYRKLYNTPVRMRVMDLEHEKGGLQVVKLGGGMQTQSLRMVDPRGREWVLRSIQKYPERSLPESLRKTFAKNIVQDQISIAHPFGALTVPPFNRALGIPYASPELVYVGDDPILGDYRQIFKNRAYMFEARTPFEAQKTDNTAKVIRKVLADNDTQIDQKLTLRARMLDFVLGDWDRHEDNWRWDPEKEKGKKVYTPVPRDRDKVYYKTSGVFPVLLSYQWLKAHLQPFSPHIRNVAHWNFNARHFDRFFLNHLTENDWVEEIKFVQQTLSDSLIHAGMLAMPDTIARLSAAELERNIQSRRDELLQTGMTYYRSLAQVVDLPLSAKSEFVDIDYKKDGSIKVDVHNKKKDGTEGRKLIKRTFLPRETKEIRIYGIAGQDEYKIHGSGHSPIKLRLIGGKDAERYYSSEKFENGRKVYVYDAKSQSFDEKQITNKIRFNLVNDTAVHQFQYDNFVYDRKGTILNVDYGVDRGLIFGFGYLIENQGFRKKPYAYRHQVMASYLTGRRSFMFDYKGNYKELIAGHDLFIHLSSLGPKNLSNFFGYGNKTVFEKSAERGISYYRNRFDIVNADIFLEKYLSPKLKLFYGSTSEYYHSKAANNVGRYFEEFNEQYPAETIYGSNFFTGIGAGIDYDTRDNAANPKSGIHVHSRLGWRAELGGEARKYAKWQHSMSVYKTLANDHLTLANRVGLDAVWGAPYFYQHAQIGGEMSLRGFNSRRFTGKTAVYNNFDLRLKLFSYSSYIVPGTVGAIGFYDIGRVWMTAEDADNWHMGYGGGIYFMPGDLLTIQGVLGVSKEATLPYIRIGLSF